MTKHGFYPSAQLARGWRNLPGIAGKAGLLRTPEKRGS